MKVVCGSCGAKYSVADDKVAGKTVKIRCKKCSEVIVVHGEQQNPFEEDEATRVFDYGGEAVWHVVVNGEQQGPFAPLQVGALLMEGKVDAEAYVWKEGFDGWKALRDVPELASLTAKGSDAPQVEADLESEGGDLFGAAAKPAAAVAAAAPAEAAGGDLFASAASKTSSAFAGGDEDDGVVASSPSSPRVSAQQASMTGQRNENSVLFSLSNLQALATGPSASSSSASSSLGSSSSASAPAASKPAGHAVGEASGLIDIRALASATSAVGANKPSSSANVDDLLAIGAGPSPLASPLAAPVLAPIAPKREEEAKSSNTGMMVGVGVVGLALIGAVGFLGYKVMNQTPQERIVERVVVQGGDDDDDNTANSAPAEAAAGSETQQVAAAGSTGSSGSRSSRSTGSTASTGSTSNTGASPTPTASAMTESSSAGSSSSPSSGSTTDAMRRLLASMTTAPATAPATTAPAMTTTTAAAPAAAGGGPNRAEIGAALGGLRGAVSACGDGATHGVASVRVTFAPSGSVTAVSVGGDFAGTPAAGCISRAVRGARISAFQGAPTAVTYPYRL